MSKKQIPLVFKPNCRNCYWEGHQTCDREDFTPCVMWAPKEKWFSKKIDEAKKNLDKVAKASKKPKQRAGDEEDE